MPSTTDETIVEILYNENDVISIGEVIARIMVANGDSDTPNPIADEEAEVVEDVPNQPEDSKEMSKGNSGIRFTPLLFI